MGGYPYRGVEKNEHFMFIVVLRWSIDSVAKCHGILLLFQNPGTVMLGFLML